MLTVTIAHAPDLPTADPSDLELPLDLGAGAEMSTCKESAWQLQEKR